MADSRRVTDPKHNSADTKKKEKEKKDATAAALRAIEKERKDRPAASKKRPVPASGSAALEAKQRKDEAIQCQEQLIAYSEEPIPQGNPQEKTQSSSAKTSKISLKHHDPDQKHEAMSAFLPYPLLLLILEYLDNEIKMDGSESKDKETKKFSFEERRQFTLFGYHVSDFLAPKVATLILHAGEKQIEDALALVKENPDILRCEVIGEEPLRRMVKGTPLQIAAMANDVDTRPDIKKEEKYRGAVERLILAGDLSSEEIIKQLEVVTSEKAIQENEKRNQRVLNAIKKFGNDILQKREEYKGDDLEEFQAFCDSIIKQFKKDLQHDPNEIITLGYIFDLKILYEASDWFYYGYELCLMPDKKSDPNIKIKLEKGKLYLGKEDGYITYSVISPDNKEVRDIKTNIRAPQSFQLCNLNNHDGEVFFSLKHRIFEAASNAGHTITNEKRFGGLSSIQTKVFWINGFGMLETKLSSRDKNLVAVGLGHIYRDNTVPERYPTKQYPVTVFFPFPSSVGQTCCLGYYGTMFGISLLPPHVLDYFYQFKKAALQNAHTIPSMKKRSGV